MAQIVRKFIANDAVDDTKVKLSNSAYLRGRNAANSADVNILRVNGSDKIEFASVPQATLDASAGNDLVRYSQVTALLDGLKPKQAVAVASSSNINLAAAVNPSPIDGYTLVNGDRILLYGQTSAAQNGIYVANTAADPTTWTRAADFDAVSQIPGSYTVAENGTVNQGTLFVCLSSPATLGVDAINFSSRAITTYTGGDMIALAGGAFSVDLAAVSGLESSNPGNAAGQLRVKLEASNPSLQIDGSNQLGVKVDTARSLSVGVSGLGINLAASSGLQNSASALSVKLEATNPTLQIDGSNQLGVKLDAAGAIVTGASGVKVQLEAVNPTLQISTDALGVKLDPAGAIITGASGIKSQVDASTIRINGSNQLYGLTPALDEKTLSGTDITNQYVDLAHAAYSAASISLFVVGGLMQRQGADYTVSLTGGAGGVTRITFAGDLATGGNAALVAGDILEIAYDY